MCMYARAPPRSPRPLKGTAGSRLVAGLHLTVRPSGGQVLPGRKWKGVRVGVVAEIPSPVIPRGGAGLRRGPRRAATSASSRRTVGSLRRPRPRPRPSDLAPPLPWTGGRRHHPSFPCCRAAAAARRAEPGGGEAVAV